MHNGTLTVVCLLTALLWYPNACFKLIGCKVLIFFCREVTYIELLLFFELCVIYNTGHISWLLIPRPHTGPKLAFSWNKVRLKP